MAGKKESTPSVSFYLSGYNEKLFDPYLINATSDEQQNMTVSTRSLVI